MIIKHWGVLCGSLTIHYPAVDPSVEVSLLCALAMQNGVDSYH